MLESLNDKQKEAVLNTEGPCLVLAGAGSGKTKVLTTRIAYLIKELGITPSSILAITFTNKAANEMKERISKMVGLSSYEMQISTFHSFGLSIIRDNYELLGFKKNFTILDSEDSLLIIKKILKDMDKDTKEFNPKAIRNKISSAKNELMSPSKLSEFSVNEFDEVVIKATKLYLVFKVNNKIFLSMEPRAQDLQFWINIDVGKLKDPERKTRDVSTKGHHGVGNYEIIIKPTDDLYYFRSLVKQAYDDKI